MSNHTSPFAEAAMLIRKPVSTVFNAFIDPDITTKIWFTRSSGKLEEGKIIQWHWEMFNHSVDVLVKSISTNEEIIIQWGDDPEAIVTWSFKASGPDNTFVTITNKGFKGTHDELIAQVRDATGGFTWVLAGLKAYLEHGIELNLIADRYPKTED